MKIRNGFVSNSSSSSFIVGFEKIPMTQAELKDMMFPPSGYMKFNELDNLSIDVIVARVWSDLYILKPVKSCAIDEELSNGDFVYHIQTDYTEVDAIDKKYEKVYGVLKPWHEYEDWAKEHREASDRAWADYHEKVKAEVKKFKKDNWKKLGLAGKIIFCFNYSDNKGEELLEHEDIFANLPHIQISHH